MPGAVRVLSVAVASQPAGSGLPAFQARRRMVPPCTRARSHMMSPFVQAVVPAALPNRPVLDSRL